uniref:RRM domain-containing protein n=1 Tax=Graphocephala atropunctata TaxID=36148 RepID=A0A1B6MJ61_9HEMI
MSVIIRLQNLPWSANAQDIRQYFHGLSIPEGGVHIVGGEQGDAFIAFSTDEDARQAMLIDGGKIKEVKIKLYLSSRSEMQKVIETARAQSLSLQSFMQMPSAQLPAASPMTATHMPPTPTQPATHIPLTPTQTAPAMPPMLPVSQIPVKSETSEIKPPPLPPMGTIIETVKTETELEKKDQDNESVSSRDAKRSRKSGRSRSKSKNRSKSREKSKSRSKSRDRSNSRDRSYRRKDRYRDRRRRDRSRSRDRRDRRRYRDRSRSKDRSRKSSRERKRDADKIERYSLENSNGPKNVDVPDKNTEIPLPTAAEVPTVQTSKPGFSNSGWVSVGSVDKPNVGSVLSNPVGFSIGKGTPAAPQPAPPRLGASQDLSQQALPHQVQLSQQTSTTQQNQMPHPMMIPQPPSFPPLPMMNPTDLDGRFGPPSFPILNARPLNSVPPNSVFGQNQNQLTQNEPNKLMPQNQAGPMHPPVGWPPMSHPLSFTPSQQVPSGMNSMERSVTQPNMGMGMFIRPMVAPSNDKFLPPYLQQDLRMPNIFNTQLARNDNRSQIPQNLSPQRPQNYGEKNFGSTNLRDGTSNACIEIRNMSLNTTVLDIRRFFQGLQIPNDGIKIITDKKGNKVGMAYVRLAKTYFKELALKKSGQSLKASVVEILHIDDNIFDKATDFSEFSGNYFNNSQSYQEPYNDPFNEQDVQSEPFTDLVIHDIPPYTKDRDIANLYKGFKVDDAFVLARTGRKTATGYVRFRTPTEARRALTTSSRLTIGYTNIKAAICYEHEFADARDRKNMEENDEEMMDQKDLGYESRGPRDVNKYPSYDYNEERPEPRYNQGDKRLTNKGLLPTPSVRAFDPRSSSQINNSNNNFQSRFDRRQDVPPRAPREDFLSRKPYSREDFNQKPYSRESRFQPKPSRDELNKRQPSEEEYYKEPQPQKSLNIIEQVISSEKPTSVQNPASKSTVNVVDNTLENEKVKQPELKKLDTEVNNIPKPAAQNEPTLKIPSQSDKVTSTEGEASQEKVPVENCKEVAKEKIKPVEPGNLKPIQQKPEENPEDLIDTDCIFLRGLPLTATDRDILDFFSDEGLSPTQIHIMLDKQNKPSGDAFCEFNSADEAIRALTKNQTLMGRNLVCVEPVARDEMKEALGVVVPHPNNPHTDYQKGHSYPDYHRPDHRHPNMNHSGGYQPHFPPRGRGRGAFRGRHHPPTERELESQNVNAFGKPGCVVALENVPYRAEVQDILDFFRGYYVSRDNVIRRFDESGKPTGDARVCLNSPLDAHRAIRTLNSKPIFHRQIYVSIVQ